MTNEISRKILLVLFILIAVTGIAVTGKCAYKPCGTEPHSMCIYPAKLDKNVPQCSGKEARAGLKHKYRRAILNEHNRLRQKVAQGKQPGQPAAANMMKLSWNSEIETIAQRYVNSCPGVKHDKCRTLKDGTYAGQNAGNNVLKLKEGKNITAAVEGVINLFYEEVKDMTPEALERSGSPARGVVGHYTQVVWAETTQLGCGFLEQKPENEHFQFVLLICNYAPAGNYEGAKVYETGKACSKCPKGTRCSKRYPGLCTGEKDEYNDLPKSKSNDGENSGNSYLFIKSPMSFIVVFIFLLSNNFFV